jgi:AcrR family transcriptional regulator
MSDQATKALILEATIGAIEKHGLPGLTTRLIASQAGVNNAALHYYFGTKEALINAALALTLQHMLADTDEILGRSLPIRERLADLLNYLIEGTFAFPNVIRAHLWAPLMDGTSGGPFEQMQAVWANRIWREVRQEIRDSSEMAVRLALHTTLGGVVFLTLMPPSHARNPPLKLRSPAIRRRYVDQLVDFVLAAPGAPIHRRGTHRAKS